MLLFTLIKLIPLLVNLWFSIWIACSFNRNSKPSLRRIFLLLLLGIGTFGLLFVLGISPLSITIMTVLSALLCVVQALALAGRRWLGLRTWSAWSLATMALLPLVVWTDLRFRITVVEINGTPVETDPKAIYFHRPPQTYLQSYEYGQGYRLKNGVIYFGFCKWVMYGKDWRIWGAGLKRGGSMTNGKPGITDGGWSQWPIRIVVPPEAP